MKAPLRQRITSYLKKLGFIGFMFFLIKGLVWLAIFFLVKEAV